MEKNNKILEEQKRRFQQILEYVNYANNSLTDEAEGDNTQPNSQENAPQDGMQGPQTPDMNHGQVPLMDNQMPPQDNAMPVDQQMQGIEGAPEGFAPQDDTMQPDNVGGLEQAGNVTADDELVDITDLTDTQEETQKKIEGVEEDFDEKFKKVFASIQKIENLITSNDEKINSLKDEFEKRNPTDLEKLEMQSVKSGPFTVKPSDYWKEKEETSNYRIGDKDEKETFEIRANDIGGVSDWKNICDTLDDDVLYHQTMKNTMV